jgi:very-short-patch-repair endonuclease
MHVEGFEVDFHWPERKLVIEIDGGLGHNRPRTRRDDEHRDRVLGLRGWVVLRFAEDELQRALEAVSRS